MFGSIEGIHTKIIEKITLVKTAIESLVQISTKYREAASAFTGKKYTKAVASIDNLHLNLIFDKLDTLENNYNLAIVPVLTKYYGSIDHEEQNTNEYYRIITSENFMVGVAEATGQTRAAIESLRGILSLRIMAKTETWEAEDRLNIIMRIVDRASHIKINIQLKKRNYEMCKCGSRMVVIPELSELHCPNTTCGKIKTIIGAVFRDDQFYPQEGQKTKHGGYDTSRHYRFWIERLQALETKTFTDDETGRIEYVIARDGIDRWDLNCEVMRGILKDPIVGATHLNDHAPLLVKMFGGPAPPQLNFRENRLCAIRFNKVMKYYDEINPDGGNKPYYPYFIYKILENMFQDDPEKRRILDYIHLQSRETVIKNDKYYKQISMVADDLDGIIYMPTDPAGRF